MITKIVTQLKTGSIKNVVPFGTKTLPAPPYVVVKPEADPVGRGRRFRIIAHYAPDYQVFLEAYIFNEVSNLLSGFKAVSRAGNTNRLIDDEEYSDFAVSNDDGTISMERVFLLPSKLF